MAKPLCANYLCSASCPKGEALLPFDDLEAHTNGLIALSGCRLGRISSALLHRDKHVALKAAQKELGYLGRRTFGSNFSTIGCQKIIDL
jgi:DNA polymerase III alpha subunit